LFSVFPYFYFICFSLFATDDNDKNDEQAEDDQFEKVAEDNDGKATEQHGDYHTIEK